MGWDLLCGAVVRGHPFYRRLQSFGFGERLAAIADAPCPPDIIGINHYLTSDRFLDQRLALYPGVPVGGNGREQYVDVEAVRVCEPSHPGLEGALTEAWERYRIPIAVTEVHNGCTREEQLRWLREAWETAARLRERGMDVRAVTAWALLGSFDWNSLLTREDGFYEPGAFDVRSDPPRPTAVAGLLRQFANEADTDEISRGAGWWRRSQRFLPAHLGSRKGGPMDRAAPLLIVGATGTLGQAMARACERRGLAYRLVGRTELSLEEGRSAERALDTLKPWAVINAAGWVRVDDAEVDREACMRTNADGALALATASAARGIRSVTYSTDLVFDGATTRPNVEDDAVNPLSVYGESKAKAERQIAAVDADALIIRTAAFFSAQDQYNFPLAAIRSLLARRRFVAASDCVVSPTFVPDLVDATLDLLIDRESGLWHLANVGEMSWSAFAETIAKRLGLDAALIDPTPSANLDWRAQRPQYSVLGSSRGIVMPSLSSAIDRFCADLSMVLERG
jgi:dTDP-4-dehydrorhamnose reductase